CQHMNRNFHIFAVFPYTPFLQPIPRLNLFYPLSNLLYIQEEYWNLGNKTGKDPSSSSSCSNLHTYNSTWWQIKINLTYFYFKSFESLGGNIDRIIKGVVCCYFSFEYSASNSVWNFSGKIQASLGIGTS